MPKLTKRTIDAIKPTDRDVFIWDDNMPGFGIRAYPSGRKVFVVQYRVGGRGGRLRRLALGQYGPITAAQARKMAQQTLADIAVGKDPAGEKTARKKAPTVKVLFERYFAEHAAVNKKASTVAKDRQWVDRLILPKLGKTKIVDIRRADIAKLHHDLRGTPYQANRVLEILKKAFNLAIAWGLRPDNTNPCRHIQRFKEKKRERLLAADEFARLGNALDAAEQNQSELPSFIAMVRLLILTACRLGEIQNLEWAHVDLEAGCLRLPDSKTGAKIVPLGQAAIDLLADLPRGPFTKYVCPGLKPDKPLNGVHRPWYRIREVAELPDLRLHDLRHAWASLAASEGLSLPIIGAVLGHARPETTARYAHLLNEPLRQAADLVSNKIAAALAAPVVEKVVPLKQISGGENE